MRQETAPNQICVVFFFLLFIYLFLSPALTIISAQLVSKQGSLKIFHFFTKTFALKQGSGVKNRLLWRKGTYFSLNWLINEIEISWSMFHSPKRHHGIHSALHLYHWSASALTAGTWCRLITTTNRDLAAWADTGMSWQSRMEIVGRAELTLNLPYRWSLISLLSLSHEILS